MKTKFIPFVFCLLILLFLNFISADIISITSGGDTQLVINPDTYIEGFFSCVPFTCGQMGYECDSWGDGCGRTIDCGSCASGYTCTVGICVADPVVAPPSNGIVVPPAPILHVSPTEIERYMMINTNIEENIGITNLGDTSSTFSVLSSDFDPDLIVNFWDSENEEWVSALSLTLEGGGIENLRVRFSAPGNVGTYEGLILVGGVTVRVSLIVQEKLLLFDSNIIVLNKDYNVPQGEKLQTQVTLLPMGDPSRLDVTLNYKITDYTGQVYLTRSETLLITEPMNFRRDFDTGGLPLGRYVVGLELIYPAGVAPSSAHFEITEPVAIGFLGKIVLFLIAAILIVGIIIVIIYIRRYIKRVRGT